MKEILNEIIKVLEGPINLKSETRFKLLRKCYKLQDSEDNPVPSLDNIKCPRVLFRLECEKCGYPASEALYTNTDKICNGVYAKDIICKHDILQNGVETNKEQPKKFKCRKGFDGCDSYQGDSICRCQ